MQGCNSLSGPLTSHETKINSAVDPVWGHLLVSDLHLLTLNGLYSSSVFQFFG